MRKNIIKLFLFLIVFGSIFWLGGLNIRAIIGNEMFEKGTLVFRSDMPIEFERALILVYANSTIVTLIAYFVVLISVFAYLLMTKPPLKEKGWMMISIIIFSIFVPVELYTSYLDLQYVLKYFFFSGSGSEFRELMIKRISAIGGLPAIAILCYYSIIAILVWKPLNREKPNKDLNIDTKDETKL